MSDQQKKNFIVFLMLVGAGCYAVHSQAIVKQEKGIANAKDTIVECDKKLEELSGLRNRLATAQSAYQSAEQMIVQIQQAFPASTSAKSEMALELTGLPEEIGGLELKNQPPVREKPGVYRSTGLTSEDMVEVHKKLIITGMEALNIPGRTKIPVTLGITQLEQELELVGDYSAVIKFLARLGSLKYYYDILSIDMWQDFSGEGDRVEAKVLITAHVMSNFHEE